MIIGIFQVSNLFPRGAYAHIRSRFRDFFQEDHVLWSDSNVKKKNLLYSKKYLVFI